ncbi:MAG: hypothetical protein D6757_07540 [Alphaproteobacteria bacterium]|nr:MAG: hypothetical protein D6757_07540 [Alphaproteobacteria bacterium]
MMRLAGWFRGMRGATVLIAGMLPVLSGCGSLVDLKPSGPPPAHYLLHPPTPRTDDERDGAAFVLVAEPVMPRALATDGIAVREGRWRLAYLAGARWGDRAPVMVARLLRRTLEAMPQVVALGDDETGLSAGWRLVSEVDAFEIETPGPGAPPERVRIAIDIRLIRLHPTRLVAERRLEAAQPISAQGDAGAAVAAFQRAFDAIEDDLQDWLGGMLAGQSRSAAPAS